MLTTPSASSAIVRPPEAEPVKPESKLVATASETRGPPPIDSTHSRTVVNAGTAATTAPKPTRLATLKIGRTDALAPASIVLRTSGKRRQLTTTTVTIAVIRALTTDHTPPTAASDVAPTAPWPGTTRRGLGERPTSSEH